NARSYDGIDHVVAAVADLTAVGKERALQSKRKRGRRKPQLPPGLALVRRKREFPHTFDLLPRHAPAFVRNAPVCQHKETPFSFPFDWRSLQLVQQIRPTGQRIDVEVGLVGDLGEDGSGRGKV